MSDFLTLEDVNTNLFNTYNAFLHLIDTSLISDNGTYSNVKYDFCKVSKEEYTGTLFSAEYEYTIEIDSNLFSKAYKIKERIVTHEFSENVLTILSNEESLTIYFYISTSKLSSATIISNCVKYNEMFLTRKELNHKVTVPFYLILGGVEQSIEKWLTPGINEVRREYNEFIGFLLVRLKKTDFKFNCNQNLTLGKVNKVSLGTDSDYKPLGEMVTYYNSQGTMQEQYDPKITVEYGNQTLEVSYDNTLNDYCFDLDLTDITNPQNIKLKVIVERNKVINNTETDVTLFADYQTISTYADLNNACQTSNAINIFKLGADITLTDNISVSHSIKMIGANHTINLNEHNFVLLEDVHFIAENLILDSGDSAIFLNTNSKLTLNNCKFINCISTNYNGLGSCIYCDVDFENLSLADDFEINLNNCYFLNNHSNIFSGGLLNIDKCKFRNNDISVVDKNNTAFIYQTDGTATITNSIFDIDYTSTSLCTNEKNIGFAQTIIMCGETATINGATYTDLAKDGSINLFGNDYNNLSHLFVKYYYPQIETCVFSSPYGGFEALSCCHSVSGLDWVFKDNVQVTRASWNTENTNRKIRWED